LGRAKRPAKLKGEKMKTDALEIISQEGDVVAHYCASCATSKVIEETIMLTDNAFWIEESERNRNWTCDGCGVKIKKATLATSSDPYWRMYRVLTEKHGIL
jgi:hypothetical protein